MLTEYSARAVTLEVLDHLERRRQLIVQDEELIRTEVKNALAPMRQTYVEYQLPPSYFEALEAELATTLPSRWRPIALAFTDAEKRSFALWRGGDVIARLSYVLAGLVIGGLIVAAPFIPIWEKWFPFVLAIAAWWLPDAQVKWHRRRYSKALGAIVNIMEGAQPALDRHITMAELLPPEGGEKHE